MAGDTHNLEFEKRYLLDRVNQAVQRLSEALGRLHSLRRAALYGNYDPAEFDRAVMEYRTAEMEKARVIQVYVEKFGSLPEGTSQLDIDRIRSEQSEGSEAQTRTSLSYSQYREMDLENTKRLFRDGELKVVEVLEQLGVKPWRN